LTLILAVLRSISNNYAHGTVVLRLILYRTKF